MIDYYAHKPEHKCGPWVDIDTFVIKIDKPMPANTGRSLTAKEKAAIGAGQRRKQKSKATKNKISKTLKRKRKSPEHKASISRAMRGKNVSQRTREKMSIAASTKNIIIGSNLGPLKAR